MTGRGGWDTAVELLGLGVTEPSRLRRRPVQVFADAGGIHVKISHEVDRDYGCTSLHVLLPPGGWYETRFLLRREGMYHVPPGRFFRLFTGDDEFDATFVFLPKSDHRVLMELFTSENRRTLLDLKG